MKKLIFLLAMLVGFVALQAQTVTGTGAGVTRVTQQDLKLYLE